MVRLLKMVPRTKPSFEDMKPELIAEVEKTYKQRIVDRYLAKVRSDPTIKLNAEVLDQIRPKLPEVPPPPAPAAPTKPF